MIRADRAFNLASLQGEFGGTLENPIKRHRSHFVSRAAMPSTPSYTLYALTDAGQQSALRSIETRVTERGGPSGIELIEAGSLTALIGPSHKYRRFRSLEFNRHQQLQAQQVVLETAMEEVRVLPAKLGTSLPSRSKVVQLLNIHRNEFQSQLDRYGDLVEFEVIVSWDVNEIVRSILTMDGLEIPNGSRSNRNMAKALERAIDTKRRTLRAHINSAIEQIARDTVTIDSLEPSTLSRQIVLLSKDREDRFYDLLRKINASGDGKISIKCIGPLPPCSFAAVQVWKTPIADVLEARSTLRLGPSASASEIQTAYRKALRSTRGLSEVQSSYELLSRIAECQSPQQKRSAQLNPEPDDVLIQLDPETLQETYLVSVGQRI